jgi:hypothetical protein
MKTLNIKLALSALGIVAMLTGPALAQKPHRQVSQDAQTQVQSSVDTYPNPQTHSGSEMSTENGSEFINGY